MDELVEIAEKLSILNEKSLIKNNVPLKIFLFPSLISSNRIFLAWYSYLIRHYLIKKFSNRSD